MWPPMWTRIAARGLWRSAFASKSSKDMQRSSRLQSTNSTSAPAPIAASGVAMKVLEGQSTVSPRTPANSSAASAPPAQLERPSARQPVPLGPAPLERLELRALRPLLGVEHLGPEVEEPCRGRGGRTRSRTSLASDRVVSAGPQRRRKASTEARRLRPSLDQLGSWAVSSTAPTAREPARRTMPATATAMKATSAAPPSGVVAQDSSKISGASSDRDQDLDREHDRRDPGRRAPLQGAHLAQQRQALGGGGGRQPGDARRAARRPPARR